MKAVLSTIVGGPDSLVLREVPDPIPGPDEVRVRVAACGVNFPDVLIIEDRYQIKPRRPFSPGGEVAGVVDAVGANVNGFEVGDRVFGVTDAQGGMAERVNIPVRDCFLAPHELSSEEASVLLLTYGTAMYALKNCARLQPGETLLVLGAGGGVGLAAIELGRATGARVIAVASSQEKLDLARRHGASDGVLSPRGPLDTGAMKTFAARIKAVCGPPGVDVVCDPVGGDYAEPALRALAHGGRHLVVGFAAGIPKLPLNLVLLKSCQILGVLWGEFIRRESAANRANIATLLELHRQGIIRPFISERYPLERAAAAIARLAERRAVGKVIVTAT